MVAVVKACLYMIRHEERLYFILFLNMHLLKWRRCWNTWRGYCALYTETRASSNLPYSLPGVLFGIELLLVKCAPRVSAHDIAQCTTERSSLTLNSARNHHTRTGSLALRFGADWHRRAGLRTWGILELSPRSFAPTLLQARPIVAVQKPNNQSAVDFRSESRATSPMPGYGARSQISSARTHGEYVK